MPVTSAGYRLNRDRRLWNRLSAFAPRILRTCSVQVQSRIGVFVGQGSTSDSSEQGRPIGVEPLVVNTLHEGNSRAD